MNQHRISMSLACYAWSFLSSSCFVAFEVTDKVSTKLKGNVLNIIVFPLGHISCLLFLIGCICLGFHNCLAAMRVSVYEKLNEVTVTPKSSNEGESSTNLELIVTNPDLPTITKKRKTPPTSGYVEALETNEALVEKEEKSTVNKEETKEEENEVKKKEKEEEEKTVSS